MKTVYSIAAIAAATIALPATAQIVPGAGARVEVRAGLDHVNVSAEDVSEGKSGIDYSLEAGYDLRAGGALIGVYAGIGDSSTKDCTEVFGNDRACLRSDRNITVGARVGVAVGANSVIYAKGGYSNGRAHLNYVDNAASGNNFDLSDNADGYHFGAGAEYGLPAGIYLKAEYVYTKYSLNTDDLGIDTDLQRHQVLAGVGIRF